MLAKLFKHYLLFHVLQWLYDSEIMNYIYLVLFGRWKIEQNRVTCIYIYIYKFCTRLSQEYVTYCDTSVPAQSQLFFVEMIEHALTEGKQQ